MEGWTNRNTCSKLGQEITNAGPDTTTEQQSKPDQRQHTSALGVGEEHDTCLGRVGPVDGHVGVGQQVRGKRPEVQLGGRRRVRVDREESPVARHATVRFLLRSHCIPLQQQSASRNTAKQIVHVDAGLQTGYENRSTYQQHELQRPSRRYLGILD